MGWQKPSAQLSGLLASAVANLTCEMRVTFGCPSYYTPGGNLFCGVFENNIFLRLSEPDREQFLQAFPGSAAFEPMKGKPMREYVVPPPELPAELEKLELWLKRSLDYAASLPAKKKKK